MLCLISPAWNLALTLHCGLGSQWGGSRSFGSVLEKRCFWAHSFPLFSLACGSEAAHFIARNVEMKLGMSKQQHWTEQTQEHWSQRVPQKQSRYIPWRLSPAVSPIVTSVIISLVSREICQCKVRIAECGPEYYRWDCGWSLCGYLKKHWKSRLFCAQGVLFPSGTFTHTSHHKCRRNHSLQAPQNISSQCWLDIYGGLNHSKECFIMHITIACMEVWRSIMTSGASLGQCSIALPLTETQGLKGTMWPFKELR